MANEEILNSITSMNFQPSKEKKRHQEKRSKEKEKLATSENLDLENVSNRIDIKKEKTKF